MAPAVLLLVAAFASALRSEQEVFQEVFRRIDTDGDGVITPAEYAIVDYRHTYAEIDRDASGGIDLAELTAWVKLTQPRPMDRGPAGAAATMVTAPGTEVQPLVPPGAPPPG